MSRRDKSKTGGRRRLPVGWIPAGPPEVASSRLHCYMPHEAFLESGLASVILRRPDRMRRKIKLPELPVLLARILRSGVRTVVFQKTALGRADLLMRACRALGRRVVYVECDACADLGFARHVDLILAPSEALCADLARRCDVPVRRILDPYEWQEPQHLHQPWRQQAVGLPRAVWVGNGKNWHQYERLAADLEALGDEAPFSVTTISDHPEADIPWKLGSVRAEILKFDLGVIPGAPDARSGFKSENRAVLFMALGLPVVAEESPVYEKLLRDGDTALVYRNREELRQMGARLNDGAAMGALRERAFAATAPFAPEAAMVLWRLLLTGEHCGPPL